MVKAIVDINKEANKVLNVLKAQYGLRDKSEAINKMAKDYKTYVSIEPKLRPEFIRKMLKRQKEKTIRIKDFAKYYGLK
ncbi:MAG: DUF2683 family protein [Candidatus Aenigmarchaeota archaeon]|nr:DUF2683 family protein [Candidatus Aenigmarchaeota archaeon]